VSDQLAKTAITAPIAGVITRLDVEEGEMVVMGVQNQPGTILMTISDLSALNAEVKVAEADVLRLTVGSPATVTLDAVAGQSFTGRVAEIDDDVIKWFSEVALLERHATHRAIFNAWRITFFQQCREKKSRNSILKREAGAAGELW